jgi:hypothetical protein
MSRGRKERTPAQLAVLAQAREKAKIIIAERAKLNALAKEEAVSEDALPSFPLSPPIEPVSEDPPPPPESVSTPPPKEDSDSESEEDEDPRLTRPKYHYINGMYIKIK